MGWGVYFFTLTKTKTKVWLINPKTRFGLLTLKGAQELVWDVRILNGPIHQQKLSLLTFCFDNLKVRFVQVPHWPFWLIPEFLSKSIRLFYVFINGKLHFPNEKWIMLFVFLLQTVNPSYCHNSALLRKQKNPSPVFEKICITPNIGPPNSSEWNPLHYVWGRDKWVTNYIVCITKDELKARITAAFHNLNKEIIRKAHWRSRGRLEAMIEACISRYFLLILVNISDEVRCQCYLDFCVILSTIRTLHTHTHTHKICFYLSIHLSCFVTSCFFF